MSEDSLPKLFLHIGSPKTGTTSFQGFMNDNFESLFKELRLYYPFCERDSLLSQDEIPHERRGFFSIEEVRHNNGQRIMASEKPFDLVARIGRLAREEEVDVVVSDESLSAFSHPDNPFVRELCKWFQVVPVVMIKDPLDYVFGSYLQTLKASAYHGSFADFLEAQPSGAVQLRFHAEWIGVFEQIKILSFKEAKSDLIGRLLEAFDRSPEKLAGYAYKVCVRRNVSLSHECYQIIRKLNVNGMHGVARKFSLLREAQDSSSRGAPPQPDPVYTSSAGLLHAGLFESLADRLGLEKSRFVTKRACGEPVPEQQGVFFSSGVLDCLLEAVRAACRIRPEDAGYSVQTDCSAREAALARISAFRREQSAWGRFCPEEFCALDYVNLGGILDSVVIEELDGFDPFRHYVMYGRYSGRAVRKGLTLEEQVSLFSASPFVGYVPEGFVAEDYLRLNPDVQQAGVDPYHHWWAYGAREGRSVLI